jgi:LacI family transcriptional regulator
MKKRVTYLDVAKEAGVSATTVSLVLNERYDNIPQTTRDRVLQAVKDTGYRLNRLSANLRKGKTDTIGVVLPNLDFHFYAEFCQGILLACEERDYRTMFAHSRHVAEQEARQVRVFMEYQMDGFICVPDFHTIDLVGDWLDESLIGGIPSLILDDSTYGDKVDTVVTDDHAGMEMAMRHLYEAGHRRVAFLSGGRKTSPGRDREDTYVRLATEMFGHFDERLRQGTEFESGEVARHIGEWMDLDAPPTAILASSDGKAATALQTLQALRVRVPEEVALVGYCDSAVLQALGISTVAQHPVELGYAAADRLIERIAQPDLPISNLRLPVQLQIRGSSDARSRASSPSASA